jgi:large repetitive protein
MSTATWTGGTIWGGASDNATWTGGSGASGAPAAGDDVVLSLSGTHTLTLGADTPALNSLTISTGTDTLALGVFALNVGAGDVKVNAGTISLAGGTINDTGPNGISLTTGTISGFGTIAAAITATGAAHITESSSGAGGTLEITGAVTNGSGGGLILTVGSAASDTLLLDASGNSVTGATFSSASGLGTLELANAASLTVANAFALGSNNLRLDGATFTDGNNISVTTGTISGSGTISAAITASGAANITQSHAKLEITGKISGGTTTLNIGSSSSDILLLDAASSSVTNANFSDAANGSGTLEIGASGSLTVTNQLVVGSNTIQLDGAGTQLTDSNGIALAGGQMNGTGTIAASTNISGYGAVAIPISTSGSITASNGALELTKAISGRTLTIGAAGDVNADKMLLDAAGSSATSVTFSSATSVAKSLEIGASGSLTVTNQLVVGSSTVQLDGASGAVQLTDANGITLAGGSITGTGTIATATTISGYGTVGVDLLNGTGAGTISASGGTLDLTGNVNQGVGTPRTLVIANVANSDLKIDGTAASGAISITTTNQTLEVGATGALTITATQTVSGGGKIKMDGGTLTDSNNPGTSGVTLGSGASSGSISGSGAIAANVAKGGTGTTNSITASGGTLEITGAVGALGAAMDSLVVGSGASDKLLLDAASYATAATFSGSTGTLELGFNTTTHAIGSLTLTNTLAVGSNTVQLDASGPAANAVQLTDTGGITLAGGKITGTGTIATATTIQGYGTVGVDLLNGTGAGKITAIGGTLDLTGQVNQGAGTYRTLLIDTSAGSDLMIGGTASAATVDTNGGPPGSGLTNANQTLEIGAAGSLTLSVAESVTGGVIKLDGGTATFNDTSVSGLTIGASGTLEGAGVVEGAISGSGVIYANGGGGGYSPPGPAGTLDLTGQLTGAAKLEIYGAAVNTLKIDNIDTAASLTDPSGSGGYGTLEIGATGALTLTSALNSFGNRDAIKLDGGGATLTDTAGINTDAVGKITGDGVINASTISSSNQYGIQLYEKGGGELDINGALTYSGAGSAGGVQLQTDTSGGGTIALGLAAGSSSTSDTVSYVQINSGVNGAGTLKIDSGVNLTTQFVNLGSGNLDLLGAGVQLTLTQNLQLSGGYVSGTGAVNAATGITGFGTYTAALDGGAVTAAGGKLAVGGGNIDVNAATSFTISGAAANSDLAFSGVIGTATVNPTIAFSTGAHWGTLDLTGEGSGTTFTVDFHGVISGFTGAGAASSDAIDAASSGSAGDKLVWQQNGGSGTLTVEDASNHVLETLTLNGTYYQSQFNLAYNGSTFADVITYAACYCRGTMILTDIDERAVEDLRIGDSVLTASGALRPIKWIGTRAYSARFAANNPDLLPIRFKAGSLDFGVPRRDLLVSPEHAMFLDGVLISAKHLVNGATIVQEKPDDDIHYFHIELASHDVLIAEGAFSESFVDDDSRGMFHNAHEFKELYPEARAKEVVYCAPRVEDGFVLDRVRRRLAERAGLDYPEEADFGALLGEVEHCGPDGVSGWARNAAFPDAPVCLDVVVDGDFAGYAYADAERPEGGRGFAFRFAAPLDFSRGRKIELRRSADRAFLGAALFRAAQVAAA